jgi:alpha-glucosidase (family GH31 glycosyl hydrolase)
MISTFNSKGVKVIMWLTGCVNISSKDVPVGKSPDYDYVIKKGFAVNNGVPSKWWKGVGVHVDFTNPAAVKWWSEKMDLVFVDGVYGLKVDQGEHYFADSLSLMRSDERHDSGDSILTSIGRIPLLEFKRYYYDAMYDFVKSRNSTAITMARPFSHQGDFAASINKLGLGWSGDFGGDYDGLKLQINNIYTSANAGYGALACEVGGYYKKRSTKKQFVRYAQFGAMTACMINGGSNGAFTNHLPWYHDDNTVTIYKYYVTLHRQLIPYMFSAVVDAHLNGGSLLSDVSFSQESHKVGNDLFFKAITSDNDTVTFTLPEGDDWVDFWSDEKYKGGTVLTKVYSLKQAPVFIKSGAIIPLDIENSITGIGSESLKNKVSFLIYPDGNNSYLFHKPSGDGVAYEDITISVNGDTISVESKAEIDFSFLVKSKKTPVEVKGADEWQYDLNNNTIEIFKKGATFSIVL